MAGAELNLVIPQGTDYKRTLWLKHPLKLAKDFKPGTAPLTVLNIIPMPVELPSGYQLAFSLGGCNTLELTTASVTPAGNSVVSIQPYSGTSKLTCGAIALTLPVNLTGETWRGACRRKYADTTPLFSFSFTINPLIGQVIASVPSTITAALKYSEVGSGKEEEKARVIFSDIPKDFQKETEFDSIVWAKGWYYDWERVKSSGEVERPVYGRLWMTSEATK